MTDSTLEDRVLIRELYGRYALAAVQQDGDAWLACWSSDAIWKTPHFEVTGQAALEASWTATWTNFANVAPYYEVGEIVVSGDTAKAVSTVLEIISLAGGGLLKMAGMYTDEFVREGGKWRFSRRDYKSLSQEPSAA